MQVYVQSSVVEKGVTVENYGETKLDVWAGTIFAVSIVLFIVVSTAATLHQRRPAHRNSGGCGDRPQTFGRSLCADALRSWSLWRLDAGRGALPLATAYSISEALGFEREYREAFARRPSLSAYLLSSLPRARRSP